MPSKTRKQANFMRMCASSAGRKHATSKCPPKKVAQEFAAADKSSPKAGGKMVGQNVVQKPGVPRRRG